MRSKELVCCLACKSEPEEEEGLRSSRREEADAMLKSITSRVVRFAEDIKTIDSSNSSVSRTDGGSTTLEGDDAFEASSIDSEVGNLVHITDPPGCVKGDSVDFQGVAEESFRALTLSAWMVSETVSALGGELQKLHCGFDQPDETSEQRRAEDTGWGRERASRRTGKDGRDDSSGASNPPSQKRRRKRPWGFLGLSSRAKKNFQEGLPKTVDVSPVSPRAPPPRVPPSAKPPKTHTATKSTTTTKPTSSTSAAAWQPFATQTKTPDPSPARAKRLLTGCFVKKPVDEMSLNSRYRTEYEDLQWTGDASVFTIKMTRVPSNEYEDFY